nr:MAG TPA: distal tail protein [Caudoviricetes sp.]
MTKGLLLFKTSEEIIVIQAEATTPIPTGVVFWSHDKGTAKLIIQLKKDHINQTLPQGTIVPILLEFNSDTAANGRGRHIYHAVIEDALEGIVSIVLEDNILGYVGRVDGSVYIELPDSRSLDTAGRFTFDIKRSPIDEDVPELEDYYWQGFNEIIQESKRLIDQVESDCKIVLDNLNSKVTVLETQTTDIKNKQAEILKSIEEHDVFTKQESSVNVIDQIGGAESTILKKELLVNGTEGMASRFVKDLPYTNIILNGDFKNGITNWSYHQPAGNLSEFVDDVVHAKSNNGTVTGVFQPSDQRLKYGYSTKANEKFFFYALAKGTGIIQLGFDKKRGSATLTQNYTWVGVESTGTTDNEVMTFYTTGEMWIKAIIVSKSEIMNIESFYPAAEDVGVVHGQPNLRNGTSSTLSEVTFIQTQYKETNLVVSNLFKPNDLVTYAVQIDNTAGTADVFAQLVCKKSDNTYVSFNGSSVLKGSIGRSMVQVTVLEEYTNIYVKPLVKSNSTISTTVRYGEEKLINGSLEAMDEWTPSQADSGLTPINGGMVPFNEKDYEDLLSDDGIVRAETKIVGRGAEIETPFKIIEVFANRYPDIFGKTTTDAEKITCFKSIQKGVTIKSTLRGSGANASKNGQLYLKYTDGTSEFLVNNQTSEFVEISKTLTATQLDQLSSTGVLTVYATTKRNGTNDAGAISDGVTSALLEVKDLRLIVEIEANGKTIIESIIAANHVENLATQAEAEAGEDNTKTMTPLRVFQSIAQWTKNRFISLTENETVLGIKNFANGLQVGGNNVLSQNGVKRLYLNSTQNSSFNAGSATFVRYGDYVTLFLNFQVRSSGDLARDANVVADTIIDDIYEPHENFHFFIGTESNQAVVKFVGKAVKANSVLTSSQWYVGTVTYLAKNKL